MFDKSTSHHKSSAWDWLTSCLCWTNTAWSCGKWPPSQRFESYRHKISMALAKPGRYMERRVELELSGWPLCQSSLSMPAHVGQCLHVCCYSMNDYSIAPRSTKKPAISSWSTRTLRKPLKSPNGLSKAQTKAQHSSRKL